MTLSKITGFSMIAMVFIGLFAAIAYQHSAFEAAMLFCSAFGFCGFVIIAVYLIVNG